MMYCIGTTVVVLRGEDDVGSPYNQDPNDGKETPEVMISFWDHFQEEFGEDGCCDDNPTP